MDIIYLFMHRFLLIVLDFNPCRAQIQSGWVEIEYNLGQQIINVLVVEQYIGLYCPYGSDNH